MAEQLSGAEGTCREPGPEIGRVDVLRDGEAEQPAVILIAGWKARFIFEPLVERLPPELGVAVISLYPISDDDFSAVIADIPGRIRFVRAALDPAPEALADRPFVMLGYSRSGLVAHDVASQLQSSGHDVRLEVLVDTVYPGEEVLRPDIVSQARRDTYRTLLESHRYGIVAKRLRNSVVARGRKGALRLGSSLMDIAGEADSVTTSPGEVRPLTEDDYVPPAVEHPVLIYRASLSDPSRTTGRWREVVPNLEEVVVEGRHGGDEGVLGRARIDQIASDLSRRLSGTR